MKNQDIAYCPIQLHTCSVPSFGVVEFFGFRHAVERNAQTGVAVRSKHVLYRPAEGDNLVPESDLILVCNRKRTRASQKKEDAPIQDTSRCEENLEFVRYNNELQI